MWTLSRPTLAARIALPLLLTAALAARAPAQPAACAAAPVATYYAIDFECQLAGWRVYGFNFLNSGGATPNGTAPTETGTLLSPFTSVDGSGRRTFGFDLTNFASGGALVASETGDELEGGGGLISFSLSSLDQRTRLYGGRLDFSLTAATTTTPEFIDLVSQVNATVFDTDRGGPLCLFVLEELRGAGATTGPERDTCDRPLPRNLFVGFDVTSFATREDGGGVGPITGSTGAEISRVTLTVANRSDVVPEPSTYALVGGGLLALGLAARRRSRG